MLTCELLGTATIEILFPAVSVPVFTTDPPASVRLLPDNTLRLAALIIALGLLFKAKIKPVGFPVSNAKLFAPTALKLFAPNAIAEDVVAVKELGTFRLAPEPNTIPEVFIKYRFPAPVT